MWGGDLLAQVADEFGDGAAETAMLDGTRMLVAMVLTLVAVFVFQRGLARDGLPAGFASPWRAMGAGIVLTMFVFVGVFVPAMLIGQTLNIDTAALTRLDLFSSQLIMVGVLAAWALFAFGEPLPRTPEWEPVMDRGDQGQGDVGQGDGVRDDEAAGPAPVAGMAEVAHAEAPEVAVPDADPRRDWLVFFGLRTHRLAHEIRVGVLAGAAAWAAVIATLMITGSLLSLWSGGGDAAGAAEPAVSPLIVYIAGLPVFWRLMLSLAAGVVEEIFFRGFLQPRMGIALSTVCFVLGHAAYGQPMMFVGLTVLSLLYALLVRWRGNVWAAIVAHTLFDAVQLLVVVPGALMATGAGPG